MTYFMLPTTKWNSTDISIINMNYVDTDKPSHKYVHMVKYAIDRIGMHGKHLHFLV